MQSLLSQPVSRSVFFCCIWDRFHHVTIPMTVTTGLAETKTERSKCRFTTWQSDGDLRTAINVYGRRGDG